MNWDAIGAVGELIGAVAVIASLIYVGFQLKQNTAAVRGERYHAINSKFSSLYFDGADSDRIPGLINRFHIEKARICDFDPDDLVRVRFIFLASSRMLDDIFRQVTEGNLPQSALDHVDASAWFTLPIAHELWPQLRRSFADDFVQYMEKRFGYNASLNAEYEYREGEPRP